MTTDPMDAAGPRREHPNAAIQRALEAHLSRSALRGGELLQKREPRRCSDIALEAQLRSTTANPLGLHRMR